MWLEVTFLIICPLLVNGRDSDLTLRLCLLTSSGFSRGTTETRRPHVVEADKAKILFR